MRRAGSGSGDLTVWQETAARSSPSGRRVLARCEGMSTAELSCAPRAGIAVRSAREQAGLSLAQVALRLHVTSGAQDPRFEGLRHESTLRSDIHKGKGPEPHFG